MHWLVGGCTIPTGSLTLFANKLLENQCSKLLLSIPQSVPSFVMFLCVCVYIHAAILLCYVKIAPLMLATVAGRILLLVCCLNIGYTMKPRGLRDLEPRGNRYRHPRAKRKGVYRFPRGSKSHRPRGFHRIRYLYYSQSNLR